MGPEPSRAWITEDTTVPNESLNTNFEEFNLRYDRMLENGTISGRYAFARMSYRDLDLDAGTTEGETLDTWRLGIDRAFSLNDRTVLSFTAQREWLTYSVVGIGEVERTVFAANASYQLDNMDQLRVSMSISDSVGDINIYTSTNYNLSISYGWEDPVGPVTLSVGAGLRWADYPDYRIGFSVIPGGRQDTNVFANANIGFPNLAYAGFVPGLHLDASQTESNVSRFDRTTLSVGLTISSQF